MVTERALSTEDFITIPEVSSSFENLYSMVLRRRSIRDFLDREVTQDIVDQIIAFASTAPMGIPPSSVEVMVLKGMRVREFAFDVIELMKKYRRFVNPLTVELMRPLLGKDNYLAFKTFIHKCLRLQTNLVLIKQNTRFFCEKMRLEGQKQKDQGYPGAVSTAGLPSF